MSSGKVHIKASLILASGFSLGAIIDSNPQMLLSVAGALTGIMISPDLDVDSGNVSNKILRKNIGWVAEKTWNGFWYGYKKSFKHGQFGSHFPIFSTLVRIFYVYFWVILVPHSLIWFSFNTNWDLIYVLKWYVKIFLNFWFIYGLMSSDLIHQILDVSTKESK